LVHGQNDFARFAADLLAVWRRAMANDSDRQEKDQRLHAPRA